MKYDVTIGIPVYKSVDFIRRTLESALSQTYSSIEFLIVDDAGCDGAMEVIEGIKRVYPRGNDIHITQCSDLQRTLPPADSDRSGFLYDVCIAIWRELPTVPMNAESRLTMTDTDLVEKTEVRYTGEELIVTKTSYSLNHDDDCLQNSATGKLLPRCIAVNGKAL